jgi:hypothetical protein
MNNILSVLHRYPSITPDMPDWERDYIRVQDKIENINRQVRRHLSSSLCLSLVLKFW